ncbi:Cullin-4B [Agrocybe pediades]|nr:Cullin-4B [Agrocybe pediades]
MTSVFQLLSLPKTSNGLTAIKPAGLVPSTGDDGSASPPRKVARLTGESDVTSNSRSKAVKSAGGPVQIQVIGEHKSKEPSRDQLLALLRRAVHVVLTREPGPQHVMPATYEGVYSACRNLVSVLGQGKELYNIVQLELEQTVGYVERNLIQLVDEPTRWIDAFRAAFEWFERQITLLKSLLTYLDQVYVVQEKDKHNIYDLAHSLVVKRIFNSAHLMDKLHDAVNGWLDTERKNRRPHRERDAIPKLIRVIHQYHQYSSFEEFYINNTKEFYAQESAAKADELKDKPKEFFEAASTRIDEEFERAKAVLSVPSWIFVRTATEQIIWKDRVEWIADSTLSEYMKDKDLTSLAKLYTLFGRVGGTQALCKAFSVYIRVTVASIVKDVDRDDEMVQRLLDFKKLADDAIFTSFLADVVEVHTTSSADHPTSPPPAPVASASQLPPKQPDQQFLYALTDAFTMGFKARRSKPAEMIAKYLDKAMRKGQGKASDAEFQEFLDRALSLYRFTDDKDVFRTFYHRSLAKRLLLAKSASDDFEKAMLKKLKENYDPEFGMGEDMFKDLALSRESMREYHEKLPEDSAGRKLNAMVLQRSAWPFTAQKETVDLPPSMQTELTKYTNYYKSKHSGRVLDWDHSLGTVTLKARFNPGDKELTVSLYQALVLLLFNEDTEIPYTDIKEHTNMAEADLKRTLQSLACGKKKVLKKIPAGKDVDDTDVFKYNAEFTDPHRVVHINSIQAKVSPEESKKTNDSIEEDRKYTLDAAIVRIMKARKEMSYEQLKTATIEAVKSHFAPQVDTIKKRIDYLVEQEYLERSETDRSKYLYVA